MGNHGRAGIGVLVACAVMGAVDVTAPGAVREAGACDVPSTELAVSGLEDGGAAAGIYVVRVDRPAATRLTHGGADGRGDYDPSWSLDGRQIAFDRVATGREAPGNVFVVDAEAHHLRQLTVDGDGFDPSWSADGHTIFYVGSNRGGFFSVAADGGHRHRLANGRAANKPGRGAVSPDGRYLAVGTRHGIRVVNLDGSGSRRILQDAGAVGNVTWSPDGHRLAYEAYDRPGIQIIHGDGSGQRRLTHIATNNFYDWSPDGTRIAFADQDGSLHVVNTAGGGLHRLRRFTAYETYDVAWSPDSRWIAFIQITGGYAMYLIRPDGKDIHTVHLPKGVETLGLAWRPCGAH